VSPRDATRHSRIRRASRQQLLDLVLACGIADAILLAVLIFFAFVDRSKPVVAILGMIHDLNFLGLVALTASGARRRLWGWWFPIAVVLTLGPPGSILGDLRLRRQPAAQPAPAPAAPARFGR
jgi:hypothetical protein